MSPLAGDAVVSTHQRAVHRNAAADTGAEDDGEDTCCSGRCTIRRFAQCKTIGIVGKTHFTADQLSKVLTQWMTIEDGRVAVPHQAGGRGWTSGHAHADVRAATASVGFDRLNQFSNGMDRLGVGSLWSRDA